MVFFLKESFRLSHLIRKFLANKTMVLDENDFGENTTALVTGGAGGLGLELVKGLIQEGIKVIIVDIHPPATTFGQDENVVFYHCNIKDYDEVRKLYEMVKIRQGQITILFNNAGLTDISSVISCSYEKIRNVVDVNFIGAYNMIQVFLPDMIGAKKGYIVNIGSILGMITPARLGAYGASKAGLIALHVSLTHTLKMCETTSLIKTILVCPGKIHTSMFEQVSTPSKLLAPDIDPSELATQILRFIHSNTSEKIIYFPYYANLVPYITILNWPMLRIFKTLSGMDKATEILT